MSRQSSQWSRRRFLLWAGLASIARPVGAAAQSDGQRVAVENWMGTPVGQRGIPAGWQPYETPGGHPAYDLTLVERDGGRALRMRSADDHSTIAKRLDVDLKRTPILEWGWTVSRLPEGADVRRRETCDLAADVLVIWPRFPGLLRSRLIGYTWDRVTPAGTILTSPKASTVKLVIMRSGHDELGRWLTERRNVLDDYRRIYGGEPDNPGVLALSIDTNDTHSSAESTVGPLAFTA